MVQSINSEAKMSGFKTYDVHCTYMPLIPHLYNGDHDRTCIISVVEIIGVNLCKALRVTCSVQQTLDKYWLLRTLFGVPG